MTESTLVGYTDDGTPIVRMRCTDNGVEFACPFGCMYRGRPVSHIHGAGSKTGDNKAAHCGSQHGNLNPPSGYFVLIEGEEWTA
jgi:hypothetical protein